jgi:erythronate-4-phosphate dehydrogenase
MIWLACERLGHMLADLRVGIIGRGNVGSRVQTLLQAIGAETVANDPPLADSGVTGLVSLEEALEQDIVCLHVPLTQEGRYPTTRFIAQQQLGRMPDGALLVNSARGGVIDGDSLKSSLQSGRLHAALDVWPGEPDIDVELLRETTVATPHVAGYSDDGKRNGTMMVYDAFCHWAGETPSFPGPDPGEKMELIIETGSDAISKALDASCFVRQQDQAMQNLSRLPPEQRPLEFDRLRHEYPRRRDFHAWQVCCKQSGSAEILRQLGYSVL